MKVRPSTGVLYVLLILLSVGTSAYISQSLATRAAAENDYSDEIQNLTYQVGNLTERVDLLTDFVEDKLGYIKNIHPIDPGKTLELFEDRQVVIGVIPSTTSNFEDYLPFFSEIIENDLNLYAQTVDSDLEFSFVIRDAHGQAALHLEEVQYMHRLGVNMIIGGMWSSQACASLSYCNDNGIILFSPSSTSPLLAIEEDNLFRLAPTDVKQGVPIAEMLVSKGIEAVVLIQRGDAWGDYIYNILDDELSERGGVIVKKIRYAGETMEFHNYLVEAEAAAADAVEEYGWEKVGVELISFSEAVEVLRAAKDFPTLYNLTWFGTDGTVHSRQLIDDVPEEAEHLKLYSINPIIPDTEASGALMDRYEQVVGPPLGFYTACSYDIAMILGRAVIEAESVEIDDLKMIIPDVCEDYEGITGLCKLDESDDRATTNYGIYSYCFKDGELGCWEVGIYSDTGDVLWHDAPR